MFEEFLLKTDLALIYATNAVDSVDLKLVAPTYVGLLLRKARLRFQKWPGERADDVFSTAAIEALDEWDMRHQSLEERTGCLPFIAPEFECATVMPMAKVKMLAQSAIARRKIAGLQEKSDPLEFERDVNEAINARLKLPGNTRRFWLAHETQPTPQAPNMNWANFLRDRLALDHLPRNIEAEQRNLYKLVIPYNEVAKAVVRRPSVASVPSSRFRARTDIEAEANAAVNDHGYTVNIDITETYHDAAPEIHAVFHENISIDGAHFEWIGSVSPRPLHYEHHSSYLLHLLRTRTRQQILDRCNQLEREAFSEQ